MDSHVGRVRYPSSRPGRRKSRPTWKALGPIRLRSLSPGSVDVQPGADDRAAVAEITDLIPGEPEVSPAALPTAAATLPSYVQEATGTVSDSANLDDGKPHRHGQQLRWTDEDAREIANYRKLSVRPPLAACTEKEFLDDYKLFHEKTRYGSLRFGSVEGKELDIFNLYCQACLCGGFENYADGINWTGQVFPNMKNWKPGHKQTGIGNHLRTQYDRLLLDYERLHPDDLNKDCCPLCQKSDDDSRTQWLACTECGGWFHYRCALDEVHKRPKTIKARIHAFGAYENARKGIDYTCSVCLQRAQPREAAALARDEPTVSTDIDQDQDGYVGCGSEVASEVRTSQADGCDADDPRKSFKRRLGEGAVSDTFGSAEALMASRAGISKKMARAEDFGDRVRDRSAERRQQKTALVSDLIRPSEGSGSGRGGRLEDLADAAVCFDSPGTPASAQPSLTDIIFSVPTRRGIVVQKVEVRKEREGGNAGSPGSPCTTEEPENAPSADVGVEAAHGQEETTSSTSVARISESAEQLQERAEEMAESLKRDIESCKVFELAMEDGVPLKVEHQVLARSKRSKRVTAQVYVYADVPGGSVDDAFNQLSEFAAKFGAPDMDSELDDWYSKLCFRAKVKVVSELSPMLLQWCKAKEDSEFSVELDTSIPNSLTVLISTRGVEDGRVNRAFPCGSA